MKINIRPSDDFQFVEFHFSDGHYLKMKLEEADKMKEGLPRAISLALTKGENNGGWNDDCQNIECSDLIKEF